MDNVARIIARRITGNYTVHAYPVNPVGCIFHQRAVVDIDLRALRAAYFAFHNIQPRIELIERITTRNPWNWTRVAQTALNWYDRKHRSYVFFFFYIIHMIRNIGILYRERSINFLYPTCGALTSSRTCSYEGGGELGIVCSFLTDKQFLSVSASGASANSSVPDGNDWLICRCCSSNSTLLLRLSPELRDFSIFEKRSLNGASLTNFFVLVAYGKDGDRVFICDSIARWVFHRETISQVTVLQATYPRIHADVKWNIRSTFRVTF